MPVPAMPSFGDDLAAVTDRARKLLGRVPRTASLSQPHPLIANLLAADEQRRQNALKSQWSWEKPIFDTPLEKRRLRLLNRLFQAWSRCGCPPYLREKEGRGLGVVVGDFHVSFSLDPPGTNPDRRSPSTNRRHKQSEKLELHLSLRELSDDLESIPTCWTDKDETRLEDQLTDVAIGLLVAGEWAYRISRIRSRNWDIERRREIEERIRKEQEESERIERARRIKAEKDRRNKLFGEAAAWRKAVEVRNFVTAVLSEHVEGGIDESHSELEQWATWALAEADHIDPLCQSVEHLVALPEK